jgi:hypothetical protein
MPSNYRVGQSGFDFFANDEALKIIGLKSEEYG